MADMLATFGLDDSAYRKGLAAVEQAGKRTAARMSENDKFWEQSRKAVLGYSRTAVVGLGAVGTALAIARSMAANYAKEHVEFANAINAPFQQVDKLQGSLSKYILTSLSGTGSQIDRLSQVLEGYQDAWHVILNTLSGDRDPVGSARETRSQLKAWDDWEKEAPARAARAAITQRALELDLLRRVTYERQLQARLSVAVATNDFGAQRALADHVVAQQKLSAELETQLALRKEMQEIGKEQAPQNLKDQKVEQAKIDATMKLSTRLAEIEAAAENARLEREKRAENLMRTRQDSLASFGQADDDRRRTMADILRAEAPTHGGIDRLREAHALDLEVRKSEIEREYQRRKLEIMTTDQGVLSNPERIDLLQRLSAGRTTDLSLAERLSRATTPIVSGVVGTGIATSSALLGQVFGARAENPVVSEVRKTRDELKSLSDKLGEIERNTRGASRPRATYG